MIFRSTAETTFTLCTSLGLRNECDPTGKRAAWCTQKGHTGEPLRCLDFSRRRDLFFERQRQRSRYPDGAGGGDTTEPTETVRAEAGADAARPTEEVAAGAPSKGPSANVAASVSRAMAEENAGAQEHTVSGKLPASRVPGWGARPAVDCAGSNERCEAYPAGYGTQPPFGFLGRQFWLKINASCEPRAPQTGERWRFLVAPYPGSGKEHRNPKNEWVEVQISPGQSAHLYAGRHELGIPYAAPMAYLNDGGLTEYWCLGSPGYEMPAF